MSFARFTMGRFSNIPGTVKLFESPGKAGGLLRLITTGLTEDPDDGENDQYVWDLQGFANPPADGDPDVNIYAIIDDGDTRHLARAPSTGNLIAWTNSASFQFTGPIATGISVDLGSKVKVPIKLRDLNATQTEFIIIASTVDLNFPAAAFDGTDLEVDDGFVVDSWIINTDGTGVVGGGATFAFENVEAGFILTAGADADTFVVWDTSLDYGVAAVTGSSPLTNAAHFIYALTDDNNGLLDATDIVVAKAPGTITLTGAGSTPPVRDLSISPNTVVAEAGEALTFDIIPNTSGKNVTLFSYYLSVDTSSVTIADLTAPFTVGAAFSTWTVLTNKATVVGGEYELDFVIFDNTGLTPDGTQTLATLNATADGVASGSGLSPANIFFDTDPANNRETALFDGGTQLGISLPTPALTITSAPRGTIQGKVPLEGRPLDFTKEITFELRPTGSFESVSDTQFSDANDEDSTEAGIQVSTTTTGDYTLTEVPAGLFNLVAKTDLYLTGQVSVTMSANEALTDIRPTEDNGGTDRNELFAGDANADNKLDTDDVNIVFNAFGTSSGDANFSSTADFDGDSSVTITDLSLISGHTSGGATPQGVDPVFKPAADTPTAQFALSGLPEWVQEGQTFQVVVSLADGQNIRGYTFDLRFNSDLVVPVLESSASRITGYLGEAETSSMLRQFTPGEVTVVNIHQGRPAGVFGSGEVALLQFTAIAEGRPGFSLGDGFIINPKAQVANVDLGLLNGRKLERTDFTLDGRVDLADYAALMEAMGSVRGLFDLNSDGSVNSADREAFVAVFTSSPDPESTPVGSMTLSLTEEQIQPDGTAEVEVRLSDIPSVKAFEFELTYDAERFEYVSNSQNLNTLTSGEAFEVKAVEEGHLLVVNAHSTPQDVGEDNLVAKLQFNVKGEFDQANPFTIARGVLVDARDFLAPLAELGSLAAVTVPTDFALYQNYPNPFNPETTIRYDLAAQGQVSLHIYNVLGQLVDTLVDETQKAGRYTVRWDGTDARGVRVASGIYFYNINATSFKDMKRLMLLK